MREVIDGWTCWIHADGRRQAMEQVTFSIATWTFDGGLKGGLLPHLPTRVLGWLIKPMLRTAYTEGWSDRNGQLDGAGMPRVYEDS